MSNYKPLRTLFSLLSILALQGCVEVFDLYEYTKSPIVTLKTPSQPIGLGTTPEFTISNLIVGASVELFSDACITSVGTGVAVTTTLDLTSPVLTQGAYHFHARQTGPNGKLSRCSPISGAYEVSGTPFVSIWQTTAPSETITLPLRSGYNYNLLVDWGDGSESLVTSYNDTDAAHVYLVAGPYTITIMGTAEAWYFNNTGDKTKILQVTELGDLNWTNFEGAFSGCTNLSTFDGGITSAVTDMAYMFYLSTATPDTSAWDTSNVTTMTAMFRQAPNANPDTSSWITSNVINMAHLFRSATSANPDVSGWDTSSVTNMAYMFNSATIATPDTSGLGWDTSNVTNMYAMFYGATLANPDTSGSGWDTSQVTNMAYMFYQATNANPDTSGWDTTLVTTMYRMFFSATSSNPDMSNWNFANVTDMGEMFNGVTLPTATYSAMLVRIDATSAQSTITLSGGASLYNAGPSAAATARGILVGRGWVITDGGPI